MLTVDEAITIVAQGLIAQEAQSIDWENSPEIGEGDWHRVYMEIIGLVVVPMRFGEAYALLEKRAEDALVGGDE